MVAAAATTNELPANVSVITKSGLLPAIAANAGLQPTAIDVRLTDG